MTREELIAALAELGVEISEGHTDEELLQLLDAATAGRAAVAALDENDPPAGSYPPGTPPEVIAQDAAVVSGAEAQTPEQPPEPEQPAKGKGRGGKRANELVECVLGPNSPAGRLIVGNAAIESKKPGRIPRSEFERLQAEYDLREVAD